jgi:WD40 repeat protein
MLAKRNRTLLLIAWCLASNRVPADEPFVITPVGDATIDAKSPAASVLWSATTSEVRLGTLNGRALSWYLQSPNPGVPIPTIDDRTVDRIAAMTIGGTDHELLAAGFERIPKVALLPGVNLGAVPLPHPDLKVKSLAVHPSQARFVVRANQGLVVFTERSAPKTLQASQEFSLHTFSSTDQQSRLTAVDQEHGEILIWDNEMLDRLPSIGLPTVPSTADGDPPSNLKLECIAAKTQTGRIVTGDSRGRLRTWKIDLADSGPQPLPEVNLATFSDEGGALLEAHAASIQLRIPPWSTDPLKSKATDLDEAQSLRYRRSGTDHFAAAAWKTDGKFSVTRHKFPNDGEVWLANPAPDPEQPIVALAIRPDAAQIAVVPADSEVAFLEQTAPAEEAPASEMPDKAVVALEYSPNGDYLLTVGKTVCLYNSAERRLLAKAETSFGVTVAAADIHLQTNGTDALPSSATILLGTSAGKLELWKATIDDDTDLKIQLEQLHSTDCATANSIKSVRWRGNRALVEVTRDTGPERTIWLANENTPKELIPLERLLPREMVAAALFQDVSYILRLPKAAWKREQAAEGAVACGDQPLQRLSVREELIVAANAKGAIYTIVGAKSHAAAQLESVSALAINPDGKTLMAGGKVASEPFGLHSWKIVPPNAQGLVELQERQAFYETNNVIQAILWQDSGRFLSGAADGTLLQFRLNPNGSFTSVLKLSPARGGVNELSLLPQGMSRNETFVVEGGGDASLRKLDARGFLKIKADSLPKEFVPSPWYGAAIHPSGESAALVSRSGHVALLAWNLPRHLKDFLKTDLTDLTLDWKTTPVSQQPLYSAAWLPRASSKPDLVAGGADGRLHLRQDTQWLSVSPQGSSRPIYVLASHPTKRILVVGRGGPNLQPTEQILSVWPASLMPQDERRWDGHTASMRGLAFSADGRRLASVDSAGRVMVWKTTDLDPSAPLEKPAVATYQLSSSRPIGLAWLDPPANAAETHLGVANDSGRMTILRIVEQ